MVQYGELVYPMFTRKVLPACQMFYISKLKPHPTYNAEVLFSTLKILKYDTQVKFDVIFFKSADI